MSYYAVITDNQINGTSECICVGNNTFSLEVSKDVYDNIGKYMYSNGEVVENPDYDKEVLARAKGKCIEKNDALRDSALLSGVTYQNVLFDSDTDQKVNLLATIGVMSDTDTVVWYGMDNDELLCNKEDLLNIGYLITRLHTYCWTHNADIKEQIERASSVDELNEIEINYEESNNENS